MKFVVTQCSIENQNEGVRTKLEEQEEEEGGEEDGQFRSDHGWKPTGQLVDGLLGLYAYSPIYHLSVSMDFRVIRAYLSSSADSRQQV